jgi:hypothetical protein
MAGVAPGAEAASVALLAASPPMNVGREEAGRPAPRAAAAMYSGILAWTFCWNTAPQIAGPTVPPKPRIETMRPDT